MTEPIRAPEWMYWLVDFRQRLFLQTVEPIIVALLGPATLSEQSTSATQEDAYHFSRSLLSSFDSSVRLASSPSSSALHALSSDAHHRRLGFFPDYIYNAEAVTVTSMSFATLMMLFVTLSCVFLVFLSCFYHNQKTSPLFVSPRRHRLPKLVPPPLPVDGYFSWVKVCFFLSDEEVINRIGYDSLIFLRFHRLALRCIVKMSVFSFCVLLPLNFTGGRHANAQDLKEYVGALFFTDFLRFTMANVVRGSPRLWVHCFAAYLLTAIVIKELLVEYETFNSIRHRYLLSSEPHLRTVLVTNIPRHLRSARKITNYFRHVYPNAVKAVFMCQNLIQLEKLIKQRTAVLSKMEKELLILCRTEKRKLYEQSFWKQCLNIRNRLEDLGLVEASQERLAKFYAELEELNLLIENEQRRRRRVMKMLDRMEAGEGAKDIDYVLASPFVTDDPSQRRVLGLQQPKAAAESANVSQQIGHPSRSFGTAGFSRQRPESIPEGNESQETDHAKATTEQALENASMPVNDDKRDTMASADMPPDSAITGDTGNILRSRSPGNVTTTQPRSVGFVNTPEDADKKEADGLMKIDSRRTNKKLKALTNARDALRRYAHFQNSDKSFLGRHIRSAAEVKNEGHIEEHINEVTDKAFVVMRTFTAATIAIQSMHSSKPGSMQVSTAPEPRDILWNNIYVSKGAYRTRSYLGEFVVLLMITLYVVPVAMVSLLVSENALVSSSPRLAQLKQASAFFSAAIALVQPLCIVGLQQLLPPLFIMIGQAEGLPSFSEVQMRAFSRYFLFQVLNVFLVTTIAGSIFDTVAKIVKSPEEGFTMLGDSLPQLSSFFITFVTVKTFLALGLELVRIMALGQAALRYILFPNATLRTKRSVIMGMRAIDDPGWFPFHKVLAQDMLVVVISVVFAIVAPLVLLPCALFCLISRIMWTHQHLYVYESVFESGGQFWPKIFRRFVFGLIIAQMTITGQFLLKEAHHEAYATICLMFLTYVFLRSTRARYDPTSSTLPLEVATVMDMTLLDESMFDQPALSADQRRHQKPQEGSSQRGSTTPPAAPMTTPKSIREPGRLIGRYDPFRKAYLQPALRAISRARPEQPFPAAQLGRDEEAVQSPEGRRSDESAEDEEWHDSGATVRLKSMNQQDRGLVNRWWEDQLQRAGEQRFFRVLIGEECGTLTISGATNADFELCDHPVLSNSHSLV